MAPATRTPLERASDAVGTMKQLAAILGKTPQAVSQWKAGQVPAEVCPDIEAATGGKVRCEELRPDVNWSVLRKKSKPATA